MSITIKKNIAIATALLFHISGAIGILFSPYKNWFIQNTSINLLVMVGLLFFTQDNTDKTNIYKIPKNLIGFFAFAFIAFIIGFGVEVVGVNTSVLFGDYKYGNLMGIKLWGVPLLIGVQWFVTIFVVVQ